jgi:hypothetical protein
MVWKIQMNLEEFLYWLGARLKFAFVLFGFNFCPKRLNFLFENTLNVRVNIAKQTEKKVQ